MTPPPVHIRVDAETHPSEARIDAWRAALGFSHNVVVAPEDRAAFGAQLDGHHLGAVMLADIRAGRHTAVRDRDVILRHAFDCIAVDAFLEGGLTGRFGAREVAVKVGDCVLLDVMETMSIDLTDHRCLSLIVPRATLEARAPGVGPVGGLVFPAGSPEARLVTGLLEHLLCVAPVLSDAMAEAAGLAAVDLVAACLGPRPAVRRGPKPKRRDFDMARLDRFIARNVARKSLGPDQICRHFKMSRATLYRVLQPRGGVAAIVARQRAAHAHTSLTGEVDRGLSFEEVARRSGYRDGHALRRAMREVYGAAPRDIRTASRPPGDAPVPLDAEVSAWIDAEPTLVTGGDTAP